MKLLTLLVCSLAVATAQKQYRDGEYDAYNNVIKDLTANQFDRAIADLDAWSAKFPQSDYGTDRDVLYMKSYVAAKQFPKAVDKGADLLSADFDTRFADPTQALQVLYNATVALPMIPAPTPQQTVTGKTAATKLMSFDRRPPGLADADWTKLKSDIQAPARAALLYLAMLPGNQAMTKQPRDCPAALKAYSKALEAYPDSSAVSYNLATALSCEKRIPEALYEFQRAAVIDPSLGGTSKPEQIRDIADNAYVKVHGSREGLDQLKELARKSPLPPQGFTVKTAADLEAEHDAAFEAANPQLALWKKIKQALSAPDGQEYFESQLKNAAVPQLRGVLVSARPACRPTELLVAVPMGSEKESLQPEIALKLEKPLTGQPQPGIDLQWQGVPVAFSASPMLLTMDTPVTSLQGIKTTPCSPATKKK